MTAILVTGAGGFVGRQICKALAAAGHEVIELHRTGAAEAGSALSRTTDDLFSEDEEGLRALLAGVNTVIHAAWYAEPGKYETSLRNLDCLAGTVRLGKAAIEAWVERFVGLGTCAEYDFDRAEREDAFPLEPDARLGPTSVYGAAKAAAFLALNRAMDQAQLPFAWCRLFLLFGEGEDKRRLLPHVMDRIKAGAPVDLTEGKQIRDFLDVSVAGRMIADIATSSVTGPVNVCSGRAVSVRDFIVSRLPRTDELSLLRFGARAMRPGEPFRIVGRPGGLAEHGWEEDAWNT